MAAIRLGSDPPRESEAFPGRGELELGNFRLAVAVLNVGLLFQPRLAIP